MINKIQNYVKEKLPNLVGGGAKTNVNGLKFEQTTDLYSIFRKHQSFDVEGDNVMKDGEIVAVLCGKRKLYNNILMPRGIDYRDYISKQLLPDDAIMVNNKIFIIEKKFQSGSGSVDEKLQTCDFKKKQYNKLLSVAGLEVEYIYVLNDWFRRPEYNDVHEYILSVGCMYFFNEIPLATLGLLEASNTA